MSQPLDVAVANLRHAYLLLMDGHVRNHQEFARGLIAPQIRLLEGIQRARDEQASEPSKEMP